MDDPKQDDSRTEILRRHIAGLSKHFEAVLIIGTHMDETGSTKVQWGGHGNSFTLLELARCYIRSREFTELAIHVAEEVAEHFSDEEEDDETDPRLGDS